MRRLLAAPATLERLAAALDGTGPALLPTTEPRVLAALRPDEPLEYDDVAVVVPTSGSTGEPKGALLTADNLRASAAATAEVVGEGQWLLTIPSTHVGGLQVRGGVGMPGAPAIEAGERVLFAVRPADLDERMFRRAPA